MSNQIGARIKQRRRELKLSQEALARRAGYNDRSVIAKFETGRSVPDAKLADLATALETTPAYLLGTVRDKLAALGITVTEDALGNAELVDGKTGAKRQYPKSIWVKLQEREDFRKVFQDLGNAQAMPDLPDSGDEEFQNLLADAGLDSKKITKTVDTEDHLRDAVVSDRLIPAGTGMNTRYEHSIAPTGFALQPGLQMSLSRSGLDFLKNLQQLTPEELTQVDAFVQGILAARNTDTD